MSEPARIAGRVVLVALALAAVGFRPARAEGPAPPRFSDQTKAAGIDYRNVCGDLPGEKGWIHESMGAGAAWLDYDGDGKLDLYVVNGSTHDRDPGMGEPNRLWRGDGSGSFTEVTEKAGVGHRGWGYGVAVGDYDNDGDPDLFVTNFGPNALLRNDGDGTFTDVTSGAGVAGGNDWSTSTAFFDMDNDGDLDLYVGNYIVDGPGRVPRRATEAADSVYCTYRAIPVYCGPLGQVPVQDRVWRNNGDGTFADATREAGFALDKPRYTLGVVTADFDNDGDQDVYVANDSVRNSLWRNEGGGKFKDVGVSSLSALNADGRAQAGMGTNFGDYDGDGWFDIVVTNFSYDVNTLYRNLSGKFFVDESATAGMNVTTMALSWGTGFADFDHDGDVDLFVANGHIYPQVDDYDIGTRFRQRNHLFVNAGGGRLRESSAAAGPGFAIERSFRGAAFGDYDGDGDVDVFVTALSDAPLLLRNDGPARGHHLLVKLVGSRSNRDGVGARVVVTAGGTALARQRQGGGSYLSSADPRLHFGLGAANRAEKIEVFWPSGARSVLQDVAADRLLVIEEPAE